MVIVKLGGMVRVSALGGYSEAQPQFRRIGFVHAIGSYLSGKQSSQDQRNVHVHHMCGEKLCCNK